MVGATKIRIDENEADKFNKVKKFGVVATTDNTKRAALGDLQNRNVCRATVGKEAAQKDINDVKFQNSLRNAKPRVDTHWKKAPASSGTAAIVANAAVSKSCINITGGTVATAAAAQRKALTRSNSVRLPSTTTTTTATSGMQRNLSIGQTKTKTLTAKVVENKVQQVKYITKTTSSIEEKVKKVQGAESTLRREDSNLSRKSLTKLKAALARDIAKTSGAGAAVAATKATIQTHSTKLLDGVEDIDAGDADTLILVSEYVNDIYDYLFSLETEQAIKENHLDGQMEVYAKMRAVLIDWINEVHLQFNLAAETFQMAIAIIDRFLQVVKDTKRSHLQLVGVTALFIAAKYEELYPPAIADFVYITDDTYTARQILQMELRIFKALDCNLARPLPIHFLRRFSKAANVEDYHHAMSKYILELVTIEYDLASYKPSEIAAASLFLSLHLLNGNAKAATGFNNKHWTATLAWYSRYSAEHLRPITKKLAAIVRNAPHAKLKAVYTKYQSSKFHKISLRSELYGALIDSIINCKE